MPEQLTKRFYHYTHSIDVKSILENGLLCERSLLKTCVFLADRIVFMLPGIEWSDLLPDRVRLRVDLPLDWPLEKGTDNYIVAESFGTFISMIDIPPEYIQIDKEDILS